MSKLMWNRKANLFLDFEEPEITVHQEEVGTQTASSPVVVKFQSVNKSRKNPLNAICLIKGLC